MESLLTGFAAIDASGPARGLPGQLAISPSIIDRWPTVGPRRAFLVPAFQPRDVVPGLRTRRLDRLSVWALVGSILALEDAGLSPSELDGDRTAVVFGTAFGCLELTGSFLSSVRSDPAHADPSVFPETLSNLPASHVARHLGARGPNLTLSAGKVSGEVALLDAVSLLRSGEADRVLVIAGDTLTGVSYAWYESAGMLSAACSASDGKCDEGLESRGLIPGEGLVACVLEASTVAGVGRARARILDGWLVPPADTRGDGVGVDGLQERWDGLIDPVAQAPVLLISPGARAPNWLSPADAAALDRRHRDGRLRLAGGVNRGQFGASGLLQVGVALDRLALGTVDVAVVASSRGCDGQAAVLALGRGDRT